VQDGTGYSYRYFSVTGLSGLSETRGTSQHLQCNGNTIDVGYTVLNEGLLTRNPLSLQVSSVLTEIGFRVVKDTDPIRNSRRATAYEASAPLEQQV
jgi:hypothetical protein